MQPSIRIAEHTFAVDLVASDERVIGVVALDADDRQILYLTPAVVLATGGVGQLYERTSNPIEVTGDGHAMAARAGARLIDMEFVQFHPTGLAGPKDPMPLLTEAIRGEGGVLVNELGERFMVDIHPDAELAPRDVVARGNWAQQQQGHTVFLDATKSHGDKFSSRFPTVFGSAMEVGIDPRTDGIPASPGAHYHMGGIDVDLDGRSSLAGLWAAGEASCTGVHGANRLASNSLLEGLVFGARVASSVVAADAPPPTLAEALARLPQLATQQPDADLPDTQLLAELRRLMWEKVGLIRNAEGLGVALGRIDEMRSQVAARPTTLRNMVEVAWHITTAALARDESRGAHYRQDHPEKGKPVRYSFVDGELTVETLKADPLAAAS
jgi:L-aspartate oxidase